MPPRLVTNPQHLRGNIAKTAPYAGMNKKLRQCWDEQSSLNKRGSTVVPRLRKTTKRYPTHSADESRSTASVVSAAIMANHDFSTTQDTCLADRTRTSSVDTPKERQALNKNQKDQKA